MIISRLLYILLYIYMDLNEYIFRKNIFVSSKIKYMLTIDNKQLLLAFN